MVSKLIVLLSFLFESSGPQTVAIPVAVSYIRSILWVRSSNVAWLDISCYLVMILNWLMGGFTNWLELLVGWLEGHLGLSAGASIHGFAGRQSQGGRISYMATGFLQSKHPKRIEWKQHSFFWLVSEVIQSLPPHAIDYKRVLSLAQFQQEGNWILPLEGRMAR